MIKRAKVAFFRVTRNKFVGTSVISIYGPLFTNLYIKTLFKYIFFLSLKMSKFFFITLALFLSLFVYISCASIRHPLDAISDEVNNNEDEQIPLYINPKYNSFYRHQRSSYDHPRASRNSWFRVSTYQHMKPSGGSEEKNTGDNLMRWG